MAKELIYKKLLMTLPALLADVDDDIANFANFSALIHQSFPTFSWTGFYFAKGSELVLGPFQGKVACTKIPFGKGVCGAVAHIQKTLVVDNVHDFPDHIACDELSASEIVVPIVVEGTFFGVLDIDSYLLKNFDEVDKRYLEQLVAILVSYIK